jgi:hypothetical protein
MMTPPDMNGPILPEVLPPAAQTSKKALASNKGAG